MNKIYLAGPMRNFPDFNFPAFHRAADKLRAQGHIVFSPAEMDEKNHGKGFTSGLKGDHKELVSVGFSLRKALGADLAWICEEADTVALLPDWEMSKGARAEKATAEALGLEIIYLD